MELTPEQKAKRLVDIRASAARLRARKAAEAAIDDVDDRELDAVDEMVDPEDESLEAQRRRFTRTLDQGGRAVNAEEWEAAAVDDGAIDVRAIAIEEG